MNLTSFIVILAFIVPPILIILGTIYLLKLDRAVDAAAYHAQNELDEFDEDEHEIK